MQKVEHSCTFPMFAVPIFSSFSLRLRMDIEVLYFRVTSYFILPKLRAPHCIIATDCSRTWLQCYSTRLISTRVQRRLMKVDSVSGILVQVDYPSIAQPPQVLTF